MAYSTNPNLVKARRDVLLAVISHGLPLCVVVRRFGVRRSTVWRWREINCNVKDRNYNRPSRPHSFNEKNYCWVVSTISSAPKSYPTRIAKWVEDRGG